MDNRVHRIGTLNDSDNAAGKLLRATLETQAGLSKHHGMEGETKVITFIVDILPEKIKEFEDMVGVELKDIGE